MKDEAFVRCFLIRKEALYANLLTCVFSASATLVSCKMKVYFSPASVLWNGSPLFFEAPVSVLRLLGSSSLVYIMLCNVFSALIIFFFLSVLHQTIFWKQQNCIHLFVGWRKTLFMWPILYFLILFISYCCVQYYSSSIYRYILVKRNMVSIMGANLKRAFIVFWNIVKVESYFISFYFPVAGKKKQLQIRELLYNCENTVFSTEEKKKKERERARENSTFLHLCFFF